MNNISRLNLISDDPKFIVKPHDVSGERGQDINMTCLVDGNPPPSYTWFKNGNMNYVSSNVYIFCLYKLTFMFCHLVWLAAPCVNFFTYVTKTRANLYTYSRKPENNNGTIIFEIDIMKNSSPINLNLCQT